MARRNRFNHRVSEGKAMSDEYQNACNTLNWTHLKLAETLGVSKRSLYRYQSGEIDNKPAARLLRLLVLLRLTLSKPKFDDIVNQLK
jgi:hypothetical protein